MNKINKLFTILIVFLLVENCSYQKDFRTIDTGDFRIKLPSGWNEIKEKGLDTKVGMFTNFRDTLTYDLGPYTVNYEDSLQNYLFIKDTINGLVCEIQTPKKDKNGTTLLHLIGANNKYTFFLGGENIKDKMTVFEIFKSVKFNNSDSNLNGIEIQKKLKETSNDRIIKYEDCRICHKYIQSLIGYNIYGSEKKEKIKTDDWLLKFLTNRKSLLQDKEYLKILKDNNNEIINCTEFDKERELEVKQLIAFIKGTKI